MACEDKITTPCPCGKCPEPEIPFVPPNPPDCDDGTECTEMYDGACVKYSGTDLTCLGITPGMTLNTVIQTIAGLLCECAGISVCVRPIGLHSARLLSSFTTNSASPCDAGVPTIYSIATAADFTEACGLFLTFSNCVCPNNISASSYFDVQYVSLTVGQKAFFGYATNCDVIPDGIYFLWDDTTGTANGYFCNKTNIQIITIANGFITDVRSCDIS